VLENGEEVAITPICPTPLQKNVDEFLNEVEAMARIHHQNILQLKGCCLFRNKFLCMNLLKITWQILFLVIL
jgi:hypothetical protein